MAVPHDRFLDREDLERRVNRDIADRIGELTNAAKIALVDTFCGDAAFDLDTNRDPSFAPARNGRDRQRARVALDPCRQLSRKGGR